MSLTSSSILPTLQNRLLMKISKELKNTCSDRPRQAGSQEARQPAEDCLLGPALATFTAIAATNKRKRTEKISRIQKKEKKKEKKKNFLSKAEALIWSRPP